jgi:hypothetical protein
MFRCDLFYKWKGKICTEIGKGSVIETFFI